jgi:hypothetical protein
MAVGTWEDFTSKWGFQEGAQLEARDWEAREILIALLNERAEVKAAKIRAVPWDRPGVHNPCLILILPNPGGVSDAALIKAWEGDLEEVPLPDETQEIVEDLVAEAYASDIHDLTT